MYMLMRILPGIMYITIATIVSVVPKPTRGITAYWTRSTTGGWATMP